MEGEREVTAVLREMGAFGGECKNPLTLVLLLVRDVGPIYLIDAEVNKQKRCINHLALRWI